MIYLDNAATTYPKPFSVLETVYRANRKYAYNSGRGGYRESVQTAEKIFAVRDCLGRFFHCPEQNIVFTNNCTTAVNTALKGLLKPGDHVLISALEHNAVFRPIYKLAREGRITYDQVPYHPDPDRFLQNIRALEQPNTAMVAMRSRLLLRVWGGAPAGACRRLLSPKGLAFCGRRRPKCGHSAY